jgi:hypothetical protein
MPVDIPDEPANRDGNVALASSRRNELALCSGQMASVVRALLDLVLFGLFAGLYLGAVYLFVSYRFRRARASDRAYAPGVDP